MAESLIECGSEFVVADETLTCERPAGHLGGHACPSAIGKRRVREIAAAEDGCLCDPEAYDLGPEGQRRYFEDRYCPLHGEAANRAMQASRGCLDPEACRWPGGRCVEPSRCPVGRRSE